MPPSPVVIAVSRYIKIPAPRALSTPIVDTFKGHHFNPLELTGSRMSCAQRNLLEAAKHVNASKYGNRGFSRGDCGGGVGTSILAARIAFEHGPPRGPTRFAKDYMQFCPKWALSPNESEA